MVSDQVLCNGSNTSPVNFGTLSSGGSTRYAWTNNKTSIGLAASGTDYVDSFTAVNTGSAPVTATIIVTPTFVNSGTSCTGPTESFTITVNPTAQVNDIVNTVTYNNFATSIIDFGTANTSGSNTYSWTSSNTNIGLDANGEGNIATFIATNDGTAPISATIKVTPTFTNKGVSCSGPTKTFTITVNPTAQVDAVANQVLCNGAASTAVDFTSISTDGATTYFWTNSNRSIGMAASGNGNIPSFTAINSGAAPVTSIFWVTPSFANGGVISSGPPEKFNITVNPVAQVNPVRNIAIPNASATSAIVFSTANTGGTTTYVWKNNNTYTGLAESGTGNIEGFAAINRGTSPMISTIVVTPTFTSNGISCSGAEESFTITVNPTAQVNTIENLIACAHSVNSGVTFSTVNTGGTTTYAWSNSNTGIGLGAEGKGNLPSFTAINNGSLPENATIMVTPTYTSNGISSTGPAKSFTITINPVPAAVAGIGRTICFGSSTTLGAPVVSGNTYQWSSHPVGIVSSEADPSVSPLETTTYVLVETIEKTGCKAKDSVEVIVNPMPDAIAGNDRTILSGSSTTLGAPAVAGSFYVWGSAPAGYTSLLANPVVTPNLTTSYVLTEMNTKTGCSNSRSVLVTVDPLNLLTVSGPSTVCAASKNVEFATGSDMVNYQWTLPDGASIISGASTNRIVVDFSNSAKSGIVTVTAVTSKNFTVVSDNHLVEIVPLPVTPTFTVQGHTLISSAEVGNQWYLDGNPVAISGNSKSFNAPTGGIVELLVNQNGCNSEFSQSYNLPSMATSEIEINAYPNPSSGKFSLLIVSPEQIEIRIEIYNNNSMLLWKKEKIMVNQSYIESVDLEGVPSGIYNIRVTTTATNKVIKMIVVRQ